MSFHRRYVSNEQVINLFNESGVTRVFNWYTRGVDALITEAGLATQISHIIDDPDIYSQLEIEDLIIDKIHKELNKQELKK
jgi:hypothetical protein